MRIRTIKPEFFLHEGLYELERETSLPIRLAFAGLWCAADREGRFKWEPRKLGVMILPYDDADFSRVLDALTTRGFVVQYRVNDACFGYIPSFGRHQVINNRERPSDIPEPFDIEPIDASSTREAREGHAGKAEGKGREQGKERNKAAPSESEVLSYVSNGSTVPITKECALRWLTDRETSEWMRPKGLHMLPVLPNWQSDLRGYAMDWNRNVEERAAKERGKGGDIVDKSGTRWTSTA